MTKSMDDRVPKIEAREVAIPADTARVLIAVNGIFDGQLIEW
jgi:hypothetical protein